MNKDLSWILSQIGFLGNFINLPEEALTIFEGLDAMNEENVGVKNALGMSYLFAGKFDDCIKVYRESVLIVEPQNYEARCFLGMALWEKGEKEEARRLLEDAYEHGDEDIKQISSSCLSSMIVSSNVQGARHSH